jgi:hypothetical protein
MCSGLYLFILGLILAQKTFAATTSSCYNLEMDGSESDVDCGGSECWQRCVVGEDCVTDTDCETMACVAGFCVPEPVVRVLSDVGSGPPPSPVANTSSLPRYVSLTYEELNQAILVIVLVFLVPCGVLIFCLMKKTLAGEVVQQDDPSRVELIQKKEEDEDSDRERSVHDDLLEESI